MKKLYFILLSLLIINAAKAQITSSVVSGKVVDQKGLSMPGTSVTIINTSTGTKYTAQTNADGRYTLSNLNPGGPYTITVNFVGYKKEERNDITLSLGSAVY